MINYILLILLGLILGFIFDILGTRLARDEKIFKKLDIKIDLPLIFNEICTVVFILLDYYLFGYSYDFLIGLGIISMFMIIVVSDLNYFIIPDEVLIVENVYFIIIYLLKIGPISTMKHILSGLIIFALMYTILWISCNILKKEAIGGGDIKMMFTFGLILGPITGILSIFIASMIALPTSIMAVLLKKEGYIPFGPFLLIALMLIFFVGIDSTMVMRLLGLY